ncbi:MAG TPA: MFS transporter [Anaerolineaceae bacterium]|nr:MFS transporter [Anaerolineaceae bacterium]HOV06927.1 MFS transporter [Anaerolineaceae bacterium]
MNRNLLLVALSLFTWGVGEGLFIYFQPIYLQQWGADPLMIGAVFGGMGIAMALSQIPAGYLSDRYGARTLMLLSWILGTASACIMALANSLPVFIIGLILYGLTGSVQAPMNSYITNVRGNWGIGRALTFTSGLFNVGAIIGPISGGAIASHLGLKTVYLIAALVFMISTAIIFFAGKNLETHQADLESLHSGSLTHNPRFMTFLVMTFLTMFALYLPQPFTPNFLQNQQGLPLTTIGLFGAIGSLGNAVAMLALGHLNAVAGFLISQGWLLLFSFIYSKAELPVWFGIGYFFIGGYRLCRSMVLAIARSLVHPRQTGLAYGMVETMNAIAVVLAPALAGYLYSLNPYLIYQTALGLTLAVLLLNFGMLVLVRKKQNGLAN